MTITTAKVLLTVIAVLLGIIVGLVTGLLAYSRGVGVAAAIRDGGLSFAGTVGLVLLMLNHLGAL